jgi:hypothetical protein
MNELFSLSPPRQPNPERACLVFPRPLAFFPVKGAAFGGATITSFAVVT